MSNNLVPALALTALIVGGGAFYGGMRYQQSKSTRVPSRAGELRGMRTPFGGGNAQGTNGGRAMGGFTTGEIVSKDANSFTLKLRDGGSKIIFFASSTTIGKMAAGSMDDLAPGTEVVVNGSANQDGSLAASSIQIRPMGQTMPLMRDGQPRP